MKVTETSTINTYQHHAPTQILEICTFGTMSTDNMQGLLRVMWLERENCFCTRELSMCDLVTETID